MAIPDGEQRKRRLFLDPTTVDGLVDNTISVRSRTNVSRINRYFISIMNVVDPGRVVKLSESHRGIIRQPIGQVTS